MQPDHFGQASPGGAGRRVVRLRLPARRRPTPAPCATSTLDGVGRIVEPCRQSQLAQCRRARRRQLEAPADGRRPCGPRQNVEREFQVRDVARHRPHDAEIAGRPALPAAAAGDRAAARCPSSSCGRTRRTNSTAAESIPRCRCPARAPSGPRRARRRPRPTTRRWCAWCPTGCWWCRRSGCRSASRQRRTGRWSCRRSPHPRHAAFARPRRRARARGPTPRRRRWCACLPSRRCP